MKSLEQVLCFQLARAGLRDTRGSPTEWPCRASALPAAQQLRPAVPTPASSCDSATGTPADHIEGVSQPLLWAVRGIDPTAQMYEAT